MRAPQRQGCRPGRSRMPPVLLLLAALALGGPHGKAWAHEPAPGAAQAIAPADLPPARQVAEVLGRHPQVLVAREQLRAQQAAARVLSEGNHETTLRLDGAQRRDRLIDQRFQEWGATLERPWRRADKVRIDQQLGAQGIASAQIAVGDALHESGRQLLRQWFAWLRLRASEQLLEQQLRLMQEVLAVTARRVRAGDAPRQDLALGEASLAQAGFALSQAATRSEAARIELLQSFPDLSLPLAPVIATVPALEGSDEQWLQAVLSHNHELRLARAETQRRQTLAERSQAELRPDPTLGLRYGSERNSADRIVGVFITLPFAGPARQARLDEARALADAAAQHEAVLIRRLSAEVLGNARSARGARQASLQADEAAAGLRRHARLLALGYELGEGSLADVLLARRQALEAEQAAVVAVFEAAELRYRLLLDAHALWDFD